MKHYKSAKIALRWRTAPEVVNGIGETTCASLRCAYHQPIASGSTPRHGDGEFRDEGVSMPPLIAYELPFVYQEAGVRKEALVKVKVCSKCSKKLLWGHGNKEKDVDQETRDHRNKRRRRGSTEERDKEKRRSRRSGSR